MRQSETQSGAHPTAGSTNWRLPLRLARRCFWRDPSFYRWLGRLRGHGDCRNMDFDLWVDGFPGSASLIAAAALQKANPSARIVGRSHLPPFILSALYQFKPGLLLVSPPEDAIVSWAATSQANLSDCLDYYIDFHRALLPSALWLFVVAPGELVSQFDPVMEVFNLHFHTSFAPPEHNLAELISSYENASGKVNLPGINLRLARPLSAKSGIRVELRARLRNTPSLNRRMEYARWLYSIFVPNEQGIRASRLDLTTRHLPAIA